MQRGTHERRPKVALASRSKESISTSAPGLPCSIGAVYRAVANDPVELAELNAILFEEGNTAQQVYDYLVGDGYRVAFQSVNRHRSGKSCRCWRETPLKFCRECKRDTPSCVCAA